MDRWLCAARIFKSRSLAQQACSGGHVTVNGQPARPSRGVREGDEVTALCPRGKMVVKIVAVAEKRLAAPLARALYEDHSPPPPPKDDWMPRRDRGAGRPTKAERRALHKFRGDL